MIKDNTYNNTLELNQFAQYLIWVQIPMRVWRCISYHLFFKNMGGDNGRKNTTISMIPCSRDHNFTEVKSCQE